MKLLAIEMSRITSLFRMARPSGEPYYPFIIAAAAKRYRFAKAPDSIDELVGNRIEFRHGLFEGNAIESVDVYDDGVVIASRTDTDILDKFIDDFVLWLKKDHDLAMIKTHKISKVYSSTLLVESDRDMFKPFRAYAEICHMVENALRQSCGLEVMYENFGFTLSADQTQNPALKPVPFRFERKEGIDFSYKKFFAIAPLKTSQHLKILHQMEKLGG